MQENLSIPSIPIGFLKRISEENYLTEYEEEVFIARFSDMSKTDIVVAKDINISRDRYSSRMTRVYARFGIKGNRPNKANILFLHLLDLYLKKHPSPSDSVTEKAVKFILEEVNNKLKPEIRKKCGKMRVLDTGRPIPVSDIYTETKVHERVISRRFIELSKLLEDFKKSNFISFNFNSYSGEEILGTECIEKYQKIVIWGKPGSGKTTFLKHLAIDCINRISFSDYVPFFISIRQFSENQNKLSLIEYLSKKYYRSKIDRQEIEKLLIHGKVLLLLDGLDEIRNINKDYILREIQNFANIYDENRYVITCRSAAQEYIFEDFVEIEISDFNSQQISQFVTNYFSSVYAEENIIDNDNVNDSDDDIRDGGEIEEEIDDVSQTEDYSDLDEEEETSDSDSDSDSDNDSDEDELTLAREFIGRINRESRIRDLATNPLLLTLLCMVFRDSRGFPANRSELYEEGLDILLKKWDANRNIERDQAYQSLSRKRKETLLSQIAYVTFERDQYFFKRNKVGNYIREYITNLPDASDDSDALDLDSIAILKSIEAQHGLLIERAKGIYSFSHLTFHEYFTARKIADNVNPRLQEKAISKLVNHVSELRWREVILITAGMLPNADYLLDKMKNHIDSMLDEPSLKSFKNWIEKFLTSNTSDIKNPIHIRMFYFYISCMELDFQPIDPGENAELQSNYYLILSLNIARTISLNLNQTVSLTNATFSKVNFSNIRESCDLLRQTLKQGLCHTPDKQLANLIKNHIRQLPLGGDDIQEWWKTHGDAWVSGLRKILVNYKDIGHDWEFTPDQATQIKQYYDANRLLYECLLTDCYVSREVRQSILDSWLLPSRTVASA